MSSDTGSHILPEGFFPNFFMCVKKVMIHSSVGKDRPVDIFSEFVIFSAGPALSNRKLDLLC